jgi:hypothetical protein
MIVAARRGTAGHPHDRNFLVPCGTPQGASEISVVANGIASAEQPIDVLPWTLHWPIWDERIYNMLIGSLADGALWAWGPHGPIPVDPWGPKEAAQAEEATRQIVEGQQALHELGAKLQQARDTTVSAEPLAADDDDHILATRGETRNE